MPVGKGEKETPFTLYTIDAKKGDCIYLYTDGYADQFGEKDDSKFMNKQLRELFAFISHEKMEVQKEQLENEFNKWKGSIEQIDDVCIIGIKI